MQHGNGNSDGAGIDRHLHNPVEDKLIPLEPLDLNRVRSVDDLVRAMGRVAGSPGERARISEAALALQVGSGKAANSPITSTLTFSLIKSGIK
ncbi:hypothetical protein B4Q13_18625 [Lacticaseibacillus rhamnosus]